MDETKLQPVDWYRLRLDHDVDLKKTLIEWANNRAVTLAWVHALGELQDASVASGYESNTDPNSDKLVDAMDSNRHVMGVGTIIRDEDGERVHLHGPMGRKDETSTGCWAGNPKTFRGMDLLVTVLEEA